MTNREWGQIGNNYLKGLFALGFQGFLIMICVGDVYKRQPPEYADRNTLWNAAETQEKQWNSQLRCV